MSQFSIIIPVYFNEPTLATLVHKLSSISYTASAEDSFEFLFIDDGSGDKSVNVLKQLSRNDKRIGIIQLSRNFGPNAAILAGLTYAQGDAVIVMSADLQDPPEMIPNLISTWKKGNQVVVAARRKRKDPLLSRFFSKIANRLFRSLVFKDYPLGGFDFMLIDSYVVKILVTMMEKNSYIFGQALWAGFNKKVIFYDRQERSRGQSQWTYSKKIKYFIDIFVAFSYLPLRLATLMGFLLSLAGFLIALFIIGKYFFGNIEIRGWTSLILVIIITSGIQLIILGILGEYIWRTFDESRIRPPFIISSTTNLSRRSDLPPWCKPPEQKP